MEKSKTCSGGFMKTQKTFITFLTCCTILLVIPTFTYWHNQFRFDRSSDAWTVTGHNSIAVTSNVRHFTFPRYPPPTQLINITDFQYLINPEVCKPEENVFMLVIVGSHPKNGLVRDAIRNTWGNPNISGYPFKLIFVFGKLNESVIDIKKESDQYGDIVQGNFVDNYHNVTARDMMALRWTWSYCPNARFVMRADDDISVDVFLLKEVLIKKFDNRTDGFLACYAQFYNAPALRHGPYAISYDEYPKPVYDKYCSGWMYILNPKMAHRLDQAGLKVKPFWMNDAYITGSLMTELQAPIEALGIKYSYYYDNMLAMDAEPASPFPRFAVGYVGQNVTLMRNLHLKYKTATALRRAMVTDQQDQQTIVTESYMFRDIIQGNFQDSYQNMSYRDMMGLRFAWQFCSQARFVIRADDDISLNVFELTRHLNLHFDNGQNFVGCFMMMGGMPVLRTGWLYVMNMPMTYLLDITSVRVHYFWLNDAFITGRLISSLGMTPQNLNITSTMDNKQLEEMEQQDDTIPLNFTMGYSGLNETLVVALHKKYERIYNMNRDGYSIKPNH